MFTIGYGTRTRRASHKGIGEGKNTIAHKVIEFLKARYGCTEVPSRAGKYVTLEIPNRESLNENEKRFYFIGRNGAVRVGKCASKSYSITEKIQFLMAKAEEAKAKLEDDNDYVGDGTMTYPEACK